MTWKEFALEFVWDGAWRDIYVVGANLEDWQCLLDELIASMPHDIDFYIQGNKVSSAPSAKVIFERRHETSTLLQVTLGKVHLNCHFFCEEEIEFDLDPREMKSDEDLQAVKAFMRTLANVTNKPAILTHENDQEAVILTVQPESG